MVKANHQANVIQVGELRKHPNADSLSIIDIDGYQVVVRTDQYKRGDLAVHIQPDSVVSQIPPFAFLWGDQEFADGIVPEKKRRITVRRFRGEYSEGLLMPLSDFVPSVFTCTHQNEMGKPEYHYIQHFLSQEGPVTSTICHIHEGDDLADILGITHYNPPEPPDDGQTEKPTVRSKTLKGFIYRLLRRLTGGRWPAFYTETERVVDSFRPEYDVESIKKFPRALIEGEEVIYTEKIHGSNGRYTFEDGRMYVGTRKTWKTRESDNVWTRVLKEFPAIEVFCRNHPGYTVYGEVVPTQKGYDYGFTLEHPGFFMFDIKRPDDGSWANLWTAPTDLADNNFEPGLGYWHSLNLIPRVPLIGQGKFDMEYAKTLADGPTHTRGKHAREGIVIRPVEERSIRGLGRVQLKLVSNSFLEKDNK